MIPELGQLCLVLAFLMSLLQAGVPLLNRIARPYNLLHVVKPTATGTMLLITGAFAALIYSHAMDDFSVLTVVENSHSTKPMLYKIVGAWGNHEGSMLLWMWVLSGCGFLVAIMGTGRGMGHVSTHRGENERGAASSISASFSPPPNLPPMGGGIQHTLHRPGPSSDLQLKAVTLAVLGLVSAGFLAFILFTSNPFLRIFPVPADGEDLNPILQDIGLAFHPPTLYVGYVGFGIVFCYAIAGLLLKRIDSNWARAVHPWILLPWTFLTFGIGAGSWWAYRELGWGGWWFWDPVENVSLLPWLAGTALLHSNMVLERRGQLARWVALLAILTFTLSLIGTFIVRSGLITSVHSFAADPTRGMFILGYIVVTSGAALLVYSFAQIKPSRPITLLSRSGFILINNLLLVVAAAIVLVAIFYPLVLELMKLPSISVGPQYFLRTFMPITALLPILAALAPLMAWDRTSPEQLKTLCMKLLPAMLIGIFIALALISPPYALLTIGLGMTGWLLLGIFRYLARLRGSQLRIFSLIGLRHIASATAHTGLACFIFGMSLTATLKQTYEVPLTAKVPMHMGDYTLRLIAADRHEHANFTTREATFEVSHNGRVITTLTPELRYYPVRQMQTTEAALYSTPLHDIYVVLGESNYSEKKEDATLGVRMYITPGQQWIWIGFLLAAAGGFVALLTALRRKEQI